MPSILLEMLWEVFPIIGVLAVCLYWPPYFYLQPLTSSILTFLKFISIIAITACRCVRLQIHIANFWHYFPNQDLKFGCFLFNYITTALHDKRAALFHVLITLVSVFHRIFISRSARTSWNTFVRLSVGSFARKSKPPVQYQKSSQDPIYQMLLKRGRCLLSKTKTQEVP